MRLVFCFFSKCEHVFVSCDDLVIGFCFRAGDSESYASLDINKPRWLNAFTREKERWTEPTKDLDNVAFATVRTEHICIEDDDAKIAVAILLFLAFSTTRTTREW